MRASRREDVGKIKHRICYNVYVRERKVVLSMMNVKINALPETATHYKWIVVRAVDGEVWFYDAWPCNCEETAHAQALEVGGFVVENTDWLKGIFSH